MITRVGEVGINLGWSWPHKHCLVLLSSLSRRLGSIEELKYFCKRQQVAQKLTVKENRTETRDETGKEKNSQVVWQ